MNCHIRSLYLCVKDMERAIQFYQDFFEEEVTVKDDIYSIFDINGFRLGLFAFEKMNEKHSFGSNCLPSIDVESLDILKRKVENLELCFPLTQINAIAGSFLFPKA
ncbi:VOC family protein [Angelakisella massiliensis]|uniref:VOC family protein n=1 Tax=Angelakisella massiliensis TaxID=1871018 RepID=UPI0008F85B86